MKITCPYCGSLFNDTLEQCPNCGAPNSGVVRKSGKQPITIEELKKWYTDRGLPAYEVTRFFIGIDYKKPRAFGIYKDPKTGNFVVYKNKDNGQRAIRYEGTDEAYAVNELYQRLKQEIIEQKKHSARRGSAKQRIQDAALEGTSNLFKGILGTLRMFLYVFVRYLAFMVIGFGALFIIFFVIEVIKNPASIGYYHYEDTVYYAADSTPSGATEINSRYWFSYNDTDEDWSVVLTEDQVPSTLQKNKTAKKYYLTKNWDTSIPASDFLLSHSYEDIQSSFQVSRGYYNTNTTSYYHLSDSAYSDWYYYDSGRSDWYSVDALSLPEAILHTTSSEDFYYTPTWDTSTQITDFESSAAYASYESEREAQQSSFDNDDDDSGYDWGSDSSWDSGSSDWSSDW